MKPLNNMIGAFGAHGGGDVMIPKDFIRYVNGEKPSIILYGIGEISHRTSCRIQGRTGKKGK